MHMAEVALQPILEVAPTLELDLLLRHRGGPPSLATMCALIGAAVARGQTWQPAAAIGPKWPSAIGPAAGNVLG